MYHSIKLIGEHDVEYNTFDDFGLVPTSRPVVSAPPAKTQYLDINGINGPLDLSTAITGQMLYDQRTGTWEFWTRNKLMPWETLYHRLLNEVHGREFKVILEDDPNYFYFGRVFVNELKSPKKNTNIVMSYAFQPYKYELTNSLEPWLWDPFSFETGIIREYADIAVDGTYELEIPMSARQYIPTIIASNANMTVTFGGVTHQLAEGRNIITDIILPAYSDETLTFAGTGTVSVLYQGAWL